MLSPREAATIMAALLFWREEMTPHPPEIMRPYFEAVEVADLAPLSAEEIDALSRRLRQQFIDGQ